MTALRKGRKHMGRKSSEQCVGGKLSNWQRWRKKKQLFISDKVLSIDITYQREAFTRKLGTMTAYLCN